MLPGLMLVLIALMRLFPQTPFARLLHRQLVELPLLWLERMERHHILYFFVAAVMLLGAGETIAMLGSADLVFAIAWDFSLYIDALAVTYALSAASGIKRTFDMSRALLVAWSRRATGHFRGAGHQRARRVRPTRRPSANDDDAMPTFPIAA